MMKLALLFLLVAAAGCCSFARKWPKPEERTDLERWRQDLKDHFLVPDEFAELVLARMDRQRMEELELKERGCYFTRTPEGKLVFIGSKNPPIVTVGVDVGRGGDATYKSTWRRDNAGNLELVKEEVDHGHH